MQDESIKEKERSWKILCFHETQCFWDFFPPGKTASEACRDIIFSVLLENRKITGIGKRKQNLGVFCSLVKNYSFCSNSSPKGCILYKIVFFVKTDNISKCLENTLINQI